MSGYEIKQRRTTSKGDARTMITNRTRDAHHSPRRVAGIRRPSLAPRQVADKSEAPKSTSSKWLTLIGSVAPISLATAILIYTSWVRTSAYLDYFGAQPSMLGLTPQDYLLRSGSAAFAVLIGVGLLCLMATLLWQAANLVSDKLSELWLRRTRRAVSLCAAAGFVFVFLAGSATDVTTNPDRLARGGILIVSAIVLMRTLRRSQDKKPSAGIYFAQGSILMIVVLLATISITQYETDEGTAVAEYLDTDQASLPQVAVLSSEPLDVPGDLVVASSVNLTPTKSAYRYTGLRLLEYGNDRWLLLAGRRQGARSSVLVIKDGDGVHVEVTQRPQSQD